MLTANRWLPLCILGSFMLTSSPLLVQAAPLQQPQAIVVVHDIPLEDRVQSEINVNKQPYDDIIKQTAAQTAAKTVSPTVPAPVEPLPTSQQGQGQQLVQKASQFIGTMYVWGGNTPSGFDCSGLVQYSAAQVGLLLPRTSQAQSTCGTEVALNKLLPGDLVFWGTPGQATHVGIYSGSGYFIHAPQPGQAVTLTAMTAYQPNFARRII